MATSLAVVPRRWQVNGKIMELLNRRPCINARTDNFHFSVSFDPYIGDLVEFFITGRGKVDRNWTPSFMNSA